MPLKHTVQVGKVSTKLVNHVKDLQTLAIWPYLSETNTSSQLNAESDTPEVILMTGALPNPCQVRGKLIYWIESC